MVVGLDVLLEVVVVLALRNKFEKPLFVEDALDVDVETLEVAALCVPVRRLEKPLVELLFEPLWKLCNKLIRELGSKASNPLVESDFLVTVAFCDALLFLLPNSNLSNPLVSVFVAASAVFVVLVAADVSWVFFSRLAKPLVLTDLTATVFVLVAVAIV